MLRPSYGELMDILNNKNEDLDNKITSRYTIVIAASKRARQIVNGAPCDDAGVATDKAVSIAVNEIGKGKIQVLPNGSDEDDYTFDVTAYDYSSLTDSAREIDFNTDDDDDDDDDYSADFDAGYDEEAAFGDTGETLQAMEAYETEDEEDLD